MTIMLDTQYRIICPSFLFKQLSCDRFFFLTTQNSQLQPLAFCLSNYPAIAFSSAMSAANSFSTTFKVKCVHSSV
ncbi:hypothetical protein [Fischerella sp. NIES-3754]|uniref:hypothetical protein n=1 Tax=Fischerella sp. NIES-3754 TaxID=1752063 RepID=UPI0015D77C67|nr:hypothetical protein [Fischerella sp. NIES-3754]